MSLELPALASERTTPSELACVDGQLIAQDRAVISVLDDGLLRGDGVFEVMRLYAGRPYALDAHLERMQRSADNLRLPIDIGAVAADVRSLIAAARPGDVALRTLVTRGGRRVSLVEELPALPPTLALSAVLYAPTRVLDQVKSLSYGANMLCSRLARERGFDEALMITPHGRVLEAPTASFFWVRDGRVYTPPLEDHLLDSITRRAVLAVGEVSEKSTSMEDVRGADELFLASSLKEVVAVHAVDEVALTAPGPITGELAGRVSKHIAAAVADA